MKFKLNTRQRSRREFTVCILHESAADNQSLTEELQSIHEGQMKRKWSVKNKLRYLTFQSRKNACEEFGSLKRSEVNAVNLSLEQGNTSINKVGKSALQLLIFRCLITILHLLLDPYRVNVSVIRKKQTERQEQQQKYDNWHMRKNSLFWGQLITYKYN